MPTTVASGSSQGDGWGPRGPAVRLWGSGEFSSLRKDCALICKKKESTAGKGCCGCEEVIKSF